MNDTLFKNNITTQVYFFLVKKAMNKEIVHYSDIAVEFNLPNVGNSLAAAVSPILGDIFRFCEKVNQPALTSIVVRKSGVDKGIPGLGFWTLYLPNSENPTKSLKVSITNRLQNVVFDYWGSLFSAEEPTASTKPLVRSVQ